MNRVGIGLAALVLVGACQHDGARNEELREAAPASLNDSAPPVSSDRAVAPPGYSIYFDDEFDETHDGAPDPSSWDYDVDYARNDELQCYTNDRRENVRVETRTIEGRPNGVLVLQLRKESWACPQDGNKAYDYTSGSITTRARGQGAAKVVMPFGRYEIRAKLPKGVGTGPAVWMLGDSSLGRWPRSGEIDIMEEVGYEQAAGRHRVYSALHKDTSAGAWPTEVGGTGMSQFLDLEEPLSARFHVFALDWEPDRITTYVDGRAVATRIIRYDGTPGSTEHHESFVRSETPNTSTPIGWPYAMEAPDARFHMILNLAWGGAWGGQGQQIVDDGIFSQGDVEMLVDYVRIYTKDR